MEYNLSKIPFETLASSTNIAEEFNDEERRHIGQSIVGWYDSDKNSRAMWETKQQNALKLAQQITEEKSYPWPNASNVKFPLLTIAAMQFSARIAPVLIQEPDLVKHRVVGADPEGKKASKANRISRYITYQLLHENEEWEEQQDKLFIVVPILGCAFKKTYYEPVTGMCQSKLVLPKDLVVHYYAKSLETAERKTEVFELYDREIRERVLKDTYLDVDLNTNPAPNPEQRVIEDQRQGTNPPHEDRGHMPRTLLECHCYWDLDQDGYAEPYVVTVDHASAQVLRIVNRFGEITSEESEQAKQLREESLILAHSLPQLPPGEQPSPAVLAQAQKIEQKVLENQQRIQALESVTDPSILRIEPIEYYTKYSFIPSPDGGFYDLGFGALLGPINESVNTLINQLVDSGSMQNLMSGFIGRGARIEGGRMRFQPGEWKPVNAPGMSIKENIVPLPVNQPSAVLFNLLGLMVQYAERLSTVTEVMSGKNPGQNTPAYNMNAMLEQGLQVFNAVFKRNWRAFRKEVRKVYLCNSRYLDLEHYFTTLDGEFLVLQQDFQGDPKDLVPAADPNAFSNMEKVMKATALAERAQMVPGYNPIAVEKRILEAMGIPDVEEVFPITPDGQYMIPPQPDPELEMKSTDIQRRAVEGQVRGQIDAARARAEIAEREAKAMQIMAEISQMEEETDIERAKLMLEKFENDREAVAQALELMLKEKEIQVKEKQAEKAASDSSSSSGAKKSKSSSS